MRRTLLTALLLAFSSTASTATADPILSPRFDDTTVIDGLSTPVALRFDPSGNIFVAEKSGRIKLFDPLPNPGNGTVVLDIRDQVMDYQDRGLLGLALDPRYPQVPYVYTLYTYDAPPGRTAPTWGGHCDNPTGVGGGCVVSGRLVRYTMVSTSSGPQLTDPLILIQDDWYQQYPSHSIGDLRFGPDGMLYVSGGDGASYEWTDTGASNQINHTYPNAGDPPNEGGALRSQDLLDSSDPLGLNGSILRLDPATGKPASGNPLQGVRQIAFGLRNPFRISFRPGTHELWIGDVGANSWEEINRILDVNSTTVPNFGWPCYEGSGPNPGFATQPLCSALINDSLPAGTPGTKTAPFFTYAHGSAPGNSLSPSPCQNGLSSAIAGLAFYQGGDYPTRYQKALFFSDYAIACIYAMRVDANGIPDPSQIDVIERAASVPVSLEVGPNGDIFYASVMGTIQRLTYEVSVNAKASATPTSGEPPLTVQFDGSASSDPSGDAVTYAWDLDGDGAFDDSTDARPVHTYAQGVYNVRLQVTNHNGRTAVSTPIKIVSGERPTATITSPVAGTPWTAGQRISFSGTGTDPQDGALPPSAMSWQVNLLHCPLGGCHTHPLENFTGVASGSFVTAPDGFPAYYDIQLTVTDSSGFTATQTVRIDAIGTTLSFDTQPAGLPLLYAGSPMPTPHSITEVVNDTIIVEAPSPQTMNGVSYVFTGWSDGGDRAHMFAAPDADHSYTATYEPDSDGDGIADSQDPCPTSPDPTCRGTANTGGGSGASGGGCSAGGSPGLAFGLLAAAGLVRRRRRR